MDVQKEVEENSEHTKTSVSSASKVKVQFLTGSNNFDLPTITAILESSLDYIADDYIQYTNKNRTGKRIFLISMKLPSIYIKRGER